MNKRHLLYGAAVAACLLGAALSFQSAQLASEVSRQLRDKYADLARLRDLQQNEERVAGALNAFERLPSKAPPLLDDLVSLAVPEAHATIRTREVRPVAEGWSARSTEVSFNDVALSDLSRLVERAEIQRPPWRLVELNITASEQTPGRGRVTLLLEALEKTGRTK